MRRNSAASSHTAQATSCQTSSEKASPLDRTQRRRNRPHSLQHWDGVLASPPYLYQLQISAWYQNCIDSATRDLARGRTERTYPAYPLSENQQGHLKKGKFPEPSCGFDMAFCKILTCLVTKSVYPWTSGSTERSVELRGYRLHFVNHSNHSRERCR